MTTAPRSDELLRYNLVAFVDLLAQSTALRALGDLPRTDDEMKSTVASLKATVGRVRGFRNVFDQFFQATTKSAGIIDRLPPPLARQAHELRRSEIRVRGFSDSVIMDVSLAGDDENCTAMNGVYATLVAIAGTFPEMLGIGVLLRAGIDVGVGIDVTEGELYGPALERAYALESKDADWPRIAVGKGLVRYLDQVVRTLGTPIRGKYAAEMAASCRALIVNDVDGTFILDYLGPGMEAIGMATRPVAIRDCRQFAANQRAEHAADDKLRRRWENVSAYIDSRVPPGKTACA